jgi:protein-tyrosine-phosphatase/DNA-binding transcriptional ArsR family regulator
MSVQAPVVPAALRVVADPHRWRLLCELARSDLRVGELTTLLGAPQNLVSYHLRELREAGLVSARRSSFDGRDAYYRVDLNRCAEVLCDAGASLDRGLRLEVVPPAPVRRPGRRPRVLFLCTGNSARSQMAEGLLEHRSGQTVEACSAGSNPRALHENAVRVMAARGIDISRNGSKHLDQFARSRFDRVITLCDKVREVCPEFPGPAQAVHWSIPDPSVVDGTESERDAAFEEVAADLEVRIRHLIAHLSIPEGGTKDD